MKKGQGLTIPWEVADQITLTSLQDHRAYLKKELKQWNANPKSPSNPDGVWMHPEDVIKNQQIIHHMTEIIEYYGGK